MTTFLDGVRHCEVCDTAYLHKCDCKSPQDDAVAHIAESIAALTTISRHLDAALGLLAPPPDEPTDQS